MDELQEKSLMGNMGVDMVTEMAAELSVQSPPSIDSVSWYPVLSRSAQANKIAPPWWSTARDMFLRRFWRDSDHLSMVMYTAQSILTGIPLKIVARDRTIAAHVEEAELLNHILFHVSEFSETLSAAMSKFVTDYLSTDNGAFLEVIGAGDKGGPIEGQPLAVAHLDSTLCWRTGNPIYPVVYHNPLDGRAYKLHSSRVIFISQMPSPEKQMFGVGFCAVSRALQVSQHLWDIYMHKQEKLGSRPVNTLLVGSGFSAKTIMEAVSLANMAMDQEGLSRYSRVVGIGSQNPESKLNQLDLNKFDPFDEETAVNLAMYALATAFGLPISEVWAYSDSGAKRPVDNQLSRQRGKLPAEFSESLGNQINRKYLPPYLMATFDYSDDTQDERHAVINDIRARNRERDLGTNILSLRVSREQMLHDGELDRDQFIKLELEAGRLESGAPVETLFYNRDPYTQRLLNLGVPLPTAVSRNDPEEMLERIDLALTRVYAEYQTASGTEQNIKMQSVLAALNRLQSLYEEELGRLSKEEPVPAPKTRGASLSNPGTVEQFGK